MPGIKDHMYSNIKVNIEEINFSSINSKQVECKLNLGLYAEISEGCEKEVIVNLEDLGEENKEDNRASITIYFVQKGDTLWEIAKRYNTTVREILEANDIENPDEIMPGDRIIIQKTYKYKL
jgi:nucleoid-associated protein YgaU